MSKAKQYAGKNMPRGEAKPLGTKHKARSKTLPGSKKELDKSAAVGVVEKFSQPAESIDVEKSSAETQKVVDSLPPAAVDSSQTSGITPAQLATNQATAKDTTMTLTLKGLNKKGNAAIYSGLRSTVRIALINFPNKTPLQTIGVEGEFAGAPEPKRKLTKEERAALPKPTLAEKIAKREAQLARMKAAAASGM